MQSKLQRLYNLSGADNGFYILGLHSFIEHFLKDKFHIGKEYGFYDVVSHYESFLYEKKINFKKYLFKDLKNYHQITNDVRHNFSNADEEEARVNTSLFLEFCKVALITQPHELDKFRQILNSWDNRTKIEDLSYIKQMQYEITRLKNENQENISKLTEFKDLKLIISEKEKELTTISSLLKQYEIKATDNKSKVDDLRKEKNQVEMKIKELEKELSHFNGLDTYLSYLTRFTANTRTRRDYEQTFFKLSTEQDKIVQIMGTKQQYLIKGCAGSGKSIVLIHALKKLIENSKTEFDFKNRKILLLTYTNALVKYNQYITGVIGIKDSNTMISSTESYISNIFYETFPGINIDYGIYNGLISEIKLPDNITFNEFTTELDKFIYSNIITEEEYIKEKIPRKGMNKSFNLQKRQEIWKCKIELETLMENKKVLSPFYAQTKLLCRLRSNPDQAIKLTHLLIDESQDLSAITLALLRELTEGSMFMAGDSSQSLYNIYSPYKRSGINIQGNSTVLQTSFRNTLQNMRFAENYRKISNNYKNEPEYSPEAYRVGPFPEIITIPKDKSVSDALIEKIKLYINELHYDPENICILYELNKTGLEIDQKIKKAGFDTEQIRDSGFDFNSKGKIRHTTLHSSKGLDFPVVFIYIPYTTSTRENADLFRNLLYVGITRAIDSLNIFMRENDDPLLLELYKAWDETINAVR